MADDITVMEAAKALGTSAQTVRTLLRSGELHGTKLTRGSRHTWITSGKAVNAFLSQHGRLDGRRRPRSRLAKLEDAIARLQRESRQHADPAALSGDAIAVERDHLRARVVALEEALTHTRYAAELQRQADNERAVLVDHLLAATAAAERTDALRREALAELDEALAGLSRPGHPGTL